MKPIIITTRIIGRNWKGFALYPFIFAKNKETAKDPVFLNHEKIHLQQQKELWIIGFIFYYLWEIFLYGYKWNCFELEAYYYQHKLNYLENRKKFNFLKF